MSGHAGEGKPRRGRWPLIALASVFIAPVLVAYFWQPTAYVNRGQLIEVAKGDDAHAAERLVGAAERGRPRVCSVQ